MQGMMLISVMQRHTRCDAKSVMLRHARRDAQNETKHAMNNVQETRD